MAGRSKQLYAISGHLGATSGMDTGTTNTIEESAGGEVTSPNWVVDLSHLLSVRLGRQMPQMATYRVKGFRISLENKDDTANDNNYGMCAGGVINWYDPTEKRIDALQYARQYKRDLTGALRSDSDDPFAPFTSNKLYRGLRFNWTQDADGVHGATHDDTSILDGTEFSMFEIFDHYNEAIGGNPSDEGRSTSATDPGSAMWVTRLGESAYAGTSWECSYLNSAFHDGLDIDNAFIFEPDSRPFELMLSENHFDILGGLLVVKLKHTNTDNPRASDVNDDYKVRLTVFVEGWEGF